MGMGLATMAVRIYSEIKEVAMQITLDQSEIGALMGALDYYLAELREEIGKTEKYELREALKGQHALLAGVVAKLGGSTSTGGGQDQGGQSRPTGN
jgi:hypothetical protein